VEELDCKSWREVAKHVPGTFTHVQCAQRWNKVLKPGLVKGWWSPEEDERLLRAVREENVLPTNNWTVVAKRVPGRTAKQCRERWSLCLDPAIKRDHWSQEEDERLMQLHALYGNNWTAIAKEMEGRTALAVKCHVHSLERCRRRAWSPEEDAVLLNAKRQGLHWSAATKDLPKRSKYAIRVRWSALDGVSTAASASSSAAATGGTTTARAERTHDEEGESEEDEEDDQDAWDDFGDASAWERCLPPPASSSSGTAPPPTSSHNTHNNNTVTPNSSTVKPSPHPSPISLTENLGGGGVVGGGEGGGVTVLRQALTTTTTASSFTTPETRNRVLNPIQEPKKMTASLHGVPRQFSLKRARVLQVETGATTTTGGGDNSSVTLSPPHNTGSVSKFARFDSASSAFGMLLSETVGAANDDQAHVAEYCDSVGGASFPLPPPLALIGSSTTTSAALFSSCNAGTPATVQVLPTLGTTAPLGVDEGGLMMMDMGFLADLLDAPGVEDDERVPQ